MVRTLGRDSIVQFHLVTLWTELITKKGFWDKTTCSVILNWLISLNRQCTPYRIAISSVLSTTLRYQDILTVWFEDHFWEQNRTIFRLGVIRSYKIANFFQHGSNFGIVSLNFQTIEKLISPHMHVKIGVYKILNNIISCYSNFSYNGEKRNEVNLM